MPKKVPDSLKRFTIRPKQSLTTEQATALLSELAQALGVPEGDWERLAWEIAKSFIPAFQPDDKRGRPKIGYHIRMYSQFLDFLGPETETPSRQSKTQRIQEFAARQGISPTQLRLIIKRGEANGLDVMRYRLRPEYYEREGEDFEHIEAQKAARASGKSESSVRRGSSQSIKRIGPAR